MTELRNDPMNADVGPLDVLSDEGPLRVFFIVRHRYRPSNAELRAMGVSNFPDRTPGLPDDDPLLQCEREQQIQLGSGR